MDLRQIIEVILVVAVTATVRTAIAMKHIRSELWNHHQGVCYGKYILC